MTFVESGFQGRLGVGSRLSNTCNKRMEGHMTSLRQRERFRVCAPASKCAMHVNALHVVQEVLALPVDSVRCLTSLAHSRGTRHGDERSKSTVKLAAANRSRIPVEADATLKSVREGRRCNMKVSDADVMRLFGICECDRGGWERCRVPFLWSRTSRTRELAKGFLGSRSLRIDSPEGRTEHLEQSEKIILG